MRMVVLVFSVIAFFLGSCAVDEKAAVGAAYAKLSLPMMARSIAARCASPADNRVINCESVSDFSGDNTSLWEVIW